MKATDRTKTAEEIAQEGAKKLHDLESKRLARMHGDFLSDDEFSDVSDDETGGDRKRRRRGNNNSREKKQRKKKKKGDHSNPEEMSDSDDDDDDGKDKNKEGNYDVQFTADGLMYVDKQGNMVGKVGEEKEQADNESESEGSSESGSSDDEEDGKLEQHDNIGDSDDEASAANTSDDDASSVDEPSNLEVGMAIEGNYHASEQYGKKATWYNGTISAIRTNKDGEKVYDVNYDDGDLEENMTAKNVRPIPQSKEEKEEERAKNNEADMAKKKKQKAKLKARLVDVLLHIILCLLDCLGIGATVYHVHHAQSNVVSWRYTIAFCLSFLLREDRPYHIKMCCHIVPPGRCLTSCLFAT